jgi:NTE family protein
MMLRACVVVCCTTAYPIAASARCEKAPYSWMSLEGGGVKGTAYGGAVRALEDAGLMGSIKGFSGSSAGSQAASLLAAGYSGRELGDALMGLDFNQLLDDSSIGREESWLPGNPIEDIQRLFTKFGWFKGDALQQKVDDFLRVKTGLVNTTFQQLHEKTGRWLRLTGTCITTRSLEWFDHERTPDMPVALAARASSSIPLFFQPVQWKGKLYVRPGACSCLFIPLSFISLVS